MAKKNTADVLINGKIYTISGYESTAYLHRIASYLNEMEEKVSGFEGYRRLGPEEKQLLKNMNLADEYFKADGARADLEREKEQKDKELYSLKHDLIDARLEKEKLLTRIRELEAQLSEAQKRPARPTQPAAGRKIRNPEQKL
ncbi:MAG: cell division protein ZapA [Eubacteriales bacterium]|nr:cell division protein ZapA [Eubacteriales bacterium]